MSRYDDYTVKMCEATPYTDPWHEPRGADVLRVYFRAYRIPSLKLFRVRLFPGATDEDRAHLDWVLSTNRVPSQFQGAEIVGAAVRRLRRPDGTYAFRACFGRMLDDPLAQLELEQMIDLEASRHDHTARVY